MKHRFLCSFCIRKEYVLRELCINFDIPELHFLRTVYLLERYLHKIFDLSQELLQRGLESGIGSFQHGVQLASICFRPLWDLIIQSSGQVYAVGSLSEQGLLCSREFLFVGTFMPWRFLFRGDFVRARILMPHPIQSSAHF